MPSLLCSSNYSLDSKILRKAAQSIGWETLRLDGNTIPEWFSPPDSKVALFFTAPKAFSIAKQLGLSLAGCSPDWTVNLPPELLNRQMKQQRLKDAVAISDPQFVKHAVSKAFDADVYDQKTLADATKTIHPDSLVHIAEPVVWNCEFRCFVSHSNIETASVYRYQGVPVPDYDSFPEISESQMAEVYEFANSVLHHPDVKCPDAFVLDVGIIENRGWSVVECNECWACGIYDCDPASVLETLASASAPSDIISPDWDFERHYNAACP